ncbi:hypothetical protein EHQ97_00140 [Leptospira adleri]|nr:hypothetical protein EHQ97_00140 [Leptospira adleri]
MKTFFSNKLC